MEIKYVFTQKRREFGAPCRFVDVGPHILVDIEPDPKLLNDYTHVLKADKSTLCRSDMSLHEVNTTTQPTKDRGMNHEEGGWPADVDHRDEDQVARFKKKIEKDEGYIAIAKNLCDLSEKLVMENNSIDIYEEYFAGEKVLDEEQNVVQLKTFGVYHDYCCTKTHPGRCLSSISWSADAKKLAAAYMPKINSSPTSYCIDSYVWDIDNSVEPFCELKPDAPVQCITYSLRDPELLAGGYDSGQIALWDIRKGGLPVQLTPISLSHSLAVKGISWLHSKCGTEFISASSDGQVISWDARNLSEYTQLLTLDSTADPLIPNGQVHPVTCLEYDPTVPNRFMVGTDGSKILSCSRRIDAAERISLQYECHAGPLLRVERNPFLPKLFMAASAWTVQLWSEDNPSSPILSFTSKDGYIVDATWCSIRPSVLFVSKTTGFVETWDILVKHNEPISAFKLENDAITCISSFSEGRQLACGAANGSLYVLELPAAYGIITSSEKSLIASMIDRGAKLGQLLELAPREQRLKEQDAIRLEVEAVEIKKREIPPTWAPEDLAEETFAEMTSLEFGPGFLTEEALEESQQQLMKELGIEEETGEGEFLESLDRDVQTKATLQSALVEVVSEVESNTSRFPLQELSIEEESGEREFLKELERDSTSRDVLDEVLKEVRDKD